MDSNGLHGEHHLPRSRIIILSLGMACTFCLNRRAESSFWMSYIDIVAIMLNMLRASREADWELHISSIREILPWCFAYDTTNYVRYMSAYYQDMMTLKDKYPEGSHLLELVDFYPNRPS